MDGIELCARFSYITNVLRYCGPKEAAEHFLEYISGERDAERLRDVIGRFEGVYPYLSVIAEANGRDWLDHDVVEAYWIGNGLLDKVSDDDLRRAIDRLVERGLPLSLAEDRKRELPSGFVAQHLFNVIYVGVGALTGSVAVTLPNMQECRPGWGKVLEVADGTLQVLSRPLITRDDRYLLGDPDVRRIQYLPEMLPDVKVGDWVAIHWGFAPLVLSDDQLRDVERYTRRIIDVMNDYLDQRVIS